MELQIRNNSNGDTSQYSLVQYSGDMTTYSKVGIANTAEAIAASSENLLLSAKAIPLSFQKTVESAAMGTIRGVIGSITGSNAAIASGTIVGVRGLATVSGANTAGGAFVTGTQGKLIVTGTMNHADSRFNAVFAQIDCTGGTLTAGQLSGVWVDVTGITGAGGDQFNMIRLTTNAAAKPASLIYAQSDATYFADLVTPSGGAMAFVVAAGTAAGSAGAATGVAAKVMIVNIDATPYYIPLFAGNGS